MAMSARPGVEAMVKSLVAVAWADGVMHREEEAVLQALVTAFRLDDESAAEMRDYAKTRRTLDDLPLSRLLDPERRALLQHALLLTHSDGTQTDEELCVIHQLARKLAIPDDETAELITAARRRDHRAKALR